MARGDAALGIISVTARLFKHATRIHGRTLARFSAFVALNDKSVNRAVNTLVVTTEKYLESGSRYAGTRAWRSIRELEAAVKRLPAAERERSLFELERYTQMLLAHDPDLAKLISDDIAEYGLLLLRRGAARAAEQPSASAVVISAWRKAMHQAGGDALKLFRRFVAIVSLDHPAVVKASAYIRDNADSLRSAAKAARAGDASAWRGHVSAVRGLLGEAYSLLSPVWRAKYRAALKEARALAKQLGPDWDVLPVSQIENSIRLSGKEGADQMIVLVNRATKPPQAITYLSAQVKTADTSEAVAQVLNDVFQRELRPNGLLEVVVRGQPQVFQLIQHQAVQSRRYILNAAESRIPGPDLAALTKAGVEVGEEILDTSVEQLTQLSIRMINDGLAALARTGG